MYAAAPERTTELLVGTSCEISRVNSLTVGLNSRLINGYGDDAYSWVAKNQGSEFPRRFDHVFASQRLNPDTAVYLHEFDDLSDHTPLEVVFRPVGGLHDEAAQISRSTFAPGTSQTLGSSDDSESPGELTYESDCRVVVPGANYRRGRFKVGWNNAVDGAVLDEDVLNHLTWENLGWRLGRLLGDASEDLKEALYEWCVEQQLEQSQE